MKRFNEEIEQHGINYIFTLRIMPLPSFLTNYLAGMTKIPLKKFMLATVLGTIPGSLVYTFAGRQLSMIKRPEDVVSRSPWSVLFPCSGAWCLLLNIC